MKHIDCLVDWLAKHPVSNISCLFRQRISYLEWNICTLIKLYTNQLLNHFLYFKERDELYQRFMSFELSNLVVTENIDEIQKTWKEGNMTNYDYLTHLNKMAGRSFNDLMQYPVFPFILKDYVSDKLILRSPDSYRFVYCTIFISLLINCTPKKHTCIDHVTMFV